MTVTPKAGRRERPDRGPGAAPVHLRRVDIKRSKVLEQLQFEIGEAAADEGQWIVVLGENGAGKTTLLRCLAAWILSPRKGREPIVWGLGVVRAEGRTVVSFHGREEDSRVDVFGYGSLRGNALGGADRDVDFQESGLYSLFSPKARLIHAETWLRSEALEAGRSARDGEFFEAVKGTLAKLLPGDERIEIDGKDVYLRDPDGARFPLSTMSDGYLTTLGWTIDLIARWAHKYRDTGKLDGNFAQDMPCVVLVDELDLHLHPRWQLDIIPRLRKAFPKTTFVVTTHNPLTLHGARAGEVFVLQRDERGKVSIVQRDVPPGLDANRLLTGDWFGLASTLDEPTLRKLDQHRRLLLEGRPDSDPERKQLESELRQRLNGFADTSIERLAHGVVAELLDEKLRARRDITDEDRQRVIAEVRARLAGLEAPATAARERPKPYKARSSVTTTRRKTSAKKAKGRSSRA